MNLKDKISNEVKNLNKNNISVISMRLFYIISDTLLEININNNFNHDKNKIYNISAICSDNIECILNKVHLSKDEISDLIYSIIVTNIKYI
jgi:hypothetical protein